MKLPYSILIQWSEEDKCYVVSIPEFTDYYQPVTHGETYEEALNGKSDRTPPLREARGGKVGG